MQEFGGFVRIPRGVADDRQAPRDVGEGLPSDVRPALEAMGVRCVERLEELGAPLGSLVAAL